MQEVSEIISFLKKINNPSKTFFIGLGNILKGDDGVGVYIIEKLMKKFGNELKNGVKLFNVGISLENYLNKIVLLKPEKIIFFDAISHNRNEIDKEILILSEIEIQNFTFSTHNVSLKTIFDYLKLYLVNSNPETYIIGVRTENLNFGENITSTIKRTANEIVKQISLWSLKFEK